MHALWNHLYKLGHITVSFPIRFHAKFQRPSVEYFENFNHVQFYDSEVVNSTRQNIRVFQHSDSVGRRNGVELGTHVRYDSAVELENINFSRAKNQKVLAASTISLRRDRVIHLIHTIITPYGNTDGRKPIFVVGTRVDSFYIVFPELIPELTAKAIETFKTTTE